MVSPFRPHHRHDPRGAQGGAAAAARLRRGRAAPGQPQGAGRLRLAWPTSAPSRPWSRSCATPGPTGACCSRKAATIEGNPAKPRWIVDPIDGTSNFLHGIPHFAISIAVQEPRPGGNGWGEISHGLVYQPLTDESFWAEKGRGAWLQDRRLRVSSRRELADALIATGIPYKGHGDHDRFRRIFDAVAPEVAGIRRFGSAALDLAWVAAGRYDGFWEEDLQFWDIAAGIAAGARSGRLRDRLPWVGRRAFAKGQVLAGNDQIHSRLHKLVAGALRG